MNEALAGIYDSRGEGLQGEPDVTERNPAYPVSLARTEKRWGEARLKNPNCAKGDRKEGVESEDPKLGDNWNGRKISLVRKRSDPLSITASLFREKSNED